MLTDKQIRLTALVLTLGTILALAFAVDNLYRRVKALEEVCHGQCKYGDSLCAKRCQSNHHCEFQNMGE